MLKESHVSFSRKDCLTMAAIPSDLFQVYISMSKNYRGLFMGPWIGTFGAKSLLDREISFMDRPPCVQVALSLLGRPPSRSPLSPIVPRIARSMAS